MALVNKRKLIILVLSAAIILILFSLFSNTNNSSNSSTVTSDEKGMIEIEVTPTQALPLTILDESGTKEIIKLYSLPAKFSYNVGKSSFILRSYDYEDLKIDVDIIKDATVVKKIEMVSKNLPTDYSELGTTITTDDGVLVQNVQYFEYASWASGTLETGNKVVLQSIEGFWNIVYSSTSLDRNEMVSAEIPEVVINSLLGADR